MSAPPINFAMEERLEAQRRAQGWTEGGPADKNLKSYRHGLRQVGDNDNLMKQRKRK